MHSLLVLESNRAITSLLKTRLSHRDYHIDRASSLDQAKIVFKNSQWELVIVNLRSEDYTRFKIINLLHAYTQAIQMQILVITSVKNAPGRISALAAGADDCISMAFDPEELCYRVKARLRSLSYQRKNSSCAILKFKDIALDCERHTVLSQGNRVMLTTTEFRLIRFLIECNGKAQSREDLLTNVWNYDPGLETRTVDTHIKRLRKKLGNSRDLIETIYGIGYRIP